MALRASLKLLRYMAIGRFLRRNIVSLSFPIGTVTLIWLDWNHTRKWKAQLKQN